MKIYKHRLFHQWAKSERIDDTRLIEAVDEINNGLFEANLGHGLYKKRIARKGQGKRGGYRTLLAFKQDAKAIFIYGFAKNNKGNIEPKEKTIYNKLAAIYLNTTPNQISELILNGELLEIEA